MTDDWDDEDWIDEDESYDDDSYDEQDFAPCPECGAEILVDAEMCSACGHWLTTAERHRLWEGNSQVADIKYVGKIVLVLTLVALLSGLLWL